MPDRKIAIIGTAGRKDDAARLDASLWDAMHEASLAAIAEWDIGTAVSGGAPVADHLAVRAFLEGAVGKLVLFLPAPFENGRFLPTPKLRFDPGSTLQRYHGDFSRSCGVDSLREIELAREKGAELIVRAGFHTRNLDVADAATHLLAYTFGSGETSDFGPDDAGFGKSKEAGLKDGGTAHTWENAWKADCKRHVDLFSLKASLTTEPPRA
jgi:hypothetical protein